MLSGDEHLCDFLVPQYYNQVYRVIFLLLSRSIISALRCFQLRTTSYKAPPPVLLCFKHGMYIAKGSYFLLYVEGLTCQIY